MKWSWKRFNGPFAVAVMRLDILMQHYAGWEGGTAALRWSDPLGAGPLIQAHLVALLYGRILSLHPETRSELFKRVGELAKKNVRSKGATGFEFAPWDLRTDFGQRVQTLWPWLIVTPAQITASPACTATLKLGEPTAATPSGRWLQLEMARGKEQIVAPSSALIAIAGLSKESDQETRYLLARLLWQMNRFWGSANMVPFFSEALAYAAAERTVRSGLFRIP